MQVNVTKNQTDHIIDRLNTFRGGNNVLILIRHVFVERKTQNIRWPFFMTDLKRTWSLTLEIN